jgi:predicted nuclease of predicted toxin-antitoxin system
VSALVKVDENLPRQIAAMLSVRGYDAVTVLDQGWQGTPDDVLWQRVQEEGRFLITADKGFADLRRQAPGTHAGVILLRSPEESRRAYVELAAMAIESLELNDIAGTIVVVTPRGIRVRRAPKP